MRIVQSLALGLTVVASLSFAEAAVSQKTQLMLDLVKNLKSTGINADVARWEREARYDEESLSFEERISAEKDLLISQLNIQVKVQFEKSFAVFQDAKLAYEDVKKKIIKDLDLADESIRESLLSTALETLNEQLQAASGKKADEQFALIDENEREVKLERYLGALYSQNMILSAGKSVGGTDGGIDFGGAPSTTATQIRTPKYDYAKKSELIELLVSDVKSSPWVNTSYTTISSSITSSSETKASYSLKVEFMGVSLSGGPSITFKNHFETRVIVLTEGLQPIIYSDGNFDYYRRDKKNQIIKNKKGIPVRRLLNFYCEAGLEFSDDYEGGGGFKVLGMGAEGKVSKTYSNSVTLVSPRVDVPEYVENKTVTLQMLANICHNDFLNAKVSDALTVRGSLNKMMNNVLSSVVFSHSKTRCVYDTHCHNWFNNEVMALHKFHWYNPSKGTYKLKTFPRCIQEPEREMYLACEIRGLKGTDCTLYKNEKNGKVVSVNYNGHLVYNNCTPSKSNNYCYYQNKDGELDRITDGMLEYKCDKGLVCKQVSEGGWFQGWDQLYTHPVAQCVPVNSKTYKDPLAPVETNYIDLSNIEIIQN